MSTSATAPVLEYRGRALDENACGSNSIWVLAKWLLEGTPVFVPLQPGDGTRYTLYVAPVDTAASTPDSGLAREDVRHALMIVRLDGATPRGAALLTAEEMREQTGDLSGLTDGEAWATQVLAWWLAHLAGHMRRLAADDTR